MDHGHDRFYRDAEIIEVQRDIGRDHSHHPNLVAMRSNHGTASLASEERNKFLHCCPGQPSTTSPATGDSKAPGHGRPPDWPTGILLGIGGLAGGYVGARFQHRLPEAAIAQGNWASEAVRKAIDEEIAAGAMVVLGAAAGATVVLGH